MPFWPLRTSLLKRDKVLDLLIIVMPNPEGGLFFVIGNLNGTQIHGSIELPGDLTVLQWSSLTRDVKKCRNWEGGARRFQNPGHNYA